MTDLRRHRGFTLIELLTIVSVIAILAAIAVPNFLEAQVRSKISRARSDMAMISAALESYRLDHGFYPRQTTPIHPVEVRFLHANLQSKSRQGAPTLLDEIFSAAPTPTPTPQSELGMEMMMGVEDMGMMELGMLANARNPQSQTSISADEVATSAALVRNGFIYSPYGGNGLFALTSPVSYISVESLRDPFADGGLGTRGGWGYSSYELPIAPVFNYVNFQQIDPLGWKIDGLGQQLPYALFSAGPSKSMPMFPFLPVEPAVFYDPTNGTVSSGIIFNGHE